MKKWELGWAAIPDEDLTYAAAAALKSERAVLRLTSLFSADAGSLWALLWNNRAASVEVVLGPWGNAAPSATQPHFRFTSGALPSPPARNKAGRPGSPAADFEYAIPAGSDVDEVTF